MFNRHKTLSGGGNYGLFSVKCTLILLLQTFTCEM